MSLALSKQSRSMLSVHSHFTSQIRSLFDVTGVFYTFSKKHFFPALLSTGLGPLWLPCCAHPCSCFSESAFQAGLHSPSPRGQGLCPVSLSMPDSSSLAPGQEGSSVNIELNSADSGKFNSFKMCTETCQDEKHGVDSSTSTGSLCDW